MTKKWAEQSWFQRWFSGCLVAGSALLLAIVVIGLTTEDEGVQAPSVAKSEPAATSRPSADAETLEQMKASMSAVVAANEMCHDGVTAVLQTLSAKDSDVEIMKRVESTEIQCRESVAKLPAIVSPFRSPALATRWDGLIKDKCVAGNAAQAEAMKSLRAADRRPGGIKSKDLVGFLHQMNANVATLEDCLRGLTQVSADARTGL